MTDQKVCVVCGKTFVRGLTERPARFKSRTRCGFYCRPVKDADKVGRGRARSMYPLQPCEVCGKTGSGQGMTDRHHRNSDRMDNSPENIAFLCRKHHLAAHKLSDGKVGGGPRPRIVALMHDRGLERYEQAVLLRRQGLTNAEIASRLSVHLDSVRRWFSKYEKSA